MALLAGADLVLELPFLFACSAGQDFARGAVSLLSKFADTIAFGMENPEADMTRLIAAENTDAFTEALRLELSHGASYPKAHALALEALVPGGGEFITKPNNMLALSYVREIQRKGYGLKVMKVKREGDFSSKAVRAGNLEMLPDFSRRLLAEAELSDEGKLWPLVQGVMLRNRAKDLRRIYGIDEGIEGLFLKHWKDSEGLDDFIGRCVCARYTRAHIRRRLVYILLGLNREETAEAVRDGVPYARVLGFNERGREVLRDKGVGGRGKGLGVRVITRLADAEGERERYFVDVEFRASQLYELTLDTPNFKRETGKPVIIQR